MTINIIKPLKTIGSSLKEVGAVATAAYFAFGVALGFVAEIVVRNL